MRKFLTPPLFLKDQVILVTGASRGIGRAVATACAKAGATVVLLARNVKQLESLYDEILAQGAPLPAIYPFNLATATIQDYEALARNIEQQLGRLDGIIHNAAILGTLSPIEHYPLEQWQQVLQVNLNSVFMLAKVTLPLLKKSPQASIILTTADVGSKARAYWGAYAVSKFGIQALMEILNDELEVNTRIRVNAIDPGKVQTQLRNNAYPGESGKELLQPEEVAQYYVDLLHPDNMMRGEKLRVLSLQNDLSCPPFVREVGIRRPSFSHRRTV